MLFRSPSSVLLSDFVMPSEGSSQRAVSINLNSLSLSRVTDSPQFRRGQATSATIGRSSQVRAIETYSAVMNFSLHTELEEEREVNIPLRYDIHFVTAHPCAFRQHTGPLVPSTSPLSQVPGLSQQVVQTGCCLASQLPLRFNGMSRSFSSQDL